MAVRSLYLEPERPADRIEWPALETRDVFRIYRSGPVETVALRGLDMRVDRGEVVAVLGPSGCGKSTLLSLGAGLDEPSAGEVRVLGRSLGRLTEPELADWRAHELAIVFQNDNVWPALSARQNVVLTLRLAGVADPERVAEEALDDFGLTDRMSQRAGVLSGGEQQRLAIAAAAAKRAPLVLADEPTGELDAANERRVLAALRHLRDGYGSTVIAVTHASAVAAAADRVIEMRDGRVVA